MRANTATAETSVKAPLHDALLRTQLMEYVRRSASVSIFVWHRASSCFRNIVMESMSSATCDRTGNHFQDYHSCLTTKCGWKKVRMPPSPPANFLPWDLWYIFSRLSEVGSYHRVIDFLRLSELGSYHREVIENTKLAVQKDIYQKTTLYTLPPRR